MFDFPWQNQPSKKIAQIVGQYEKRKPHLIRDKILTR